MPALKRLVSSAPLPDWQRPHQFSEHAQLVFHESFEAPHRPMAAPSNTDPAINWARQAIAILEANRAKLASADSSVLGSMPRWVKTALTLPPLSDDSLPRWRRVVRTMISDRLPYFHLHADWKPLLLSIGAKDSTAAQNAILDQISAALGTTR